MSTDGLHIHHNQLNILNAPAADPERILGIWENSHNHVGNITVSHNRFNNLAPNINPQDNLQRAFRLTSHSGPATTITYTNNIITGANIGFEWLAGQNFSNHQPILLLANQVNNVGTGFHLQSNGLGHLSDNNIQGPSGIGVEVEAGSIARIDDTVDSNTFFNLNTAVQHLRHHHHPHNNNSSFISNTVGINITGGVVTITNNHLLSHTTAISLNSGIATLIGNTIDNSNTVFAQVAVT